MSNQKQEMHSHRQVKSASAKKQNNLTTYAAVLAVVAATYCFMTFGLGHVFGVI